MAECIKSSSSTTDARDQKTPTPFKMDYWNGEDLLGRTAFAEQMAQRIKVWKGKDSLVIGLCGPWGNGKSITKELVLKALRADPNDCPLILEFNPWEWSGHNEMTTAFFKQIKTILGGVDEDEAGQKAAALLAFYESYLQSTILGLEGLSDGLRTLLTSVAFIAFSASIAASSNIVKWVGFTVGGITLLLPLLKFFRKFLNSVATTYSADAKRNRKTLQDLKLELSETLRELKKPLLIIVDDVDRLAAEEIKTLFQLVKTNLNFPNLIYFLIFQKEVVEKALEETFKMGSGQEYLKKIIQSHFDLPKIDRSRLENILQKGFQTLAHDNLEVNPERLKNMFEAGFSHLFRNLRDVYRYLDTIDFHFGLFAKDQALEVDAVDLSVLEALRQFEANVYHQIPEYKFELLRQNDSPFGSGREREKITQRDKAIENLSKEATPENGEVVKQLLEFLFPSSDEAKSENVLQWLREFRVCDADSFDRYFVLSIPTGSLTNSEIRRLLNVTESADELTAALSRYVAKGRLSDVLRYLQASVKSINPRHAVPVITALFNLGDFVESRLEKSGWMITTNIDISEDITRGFLRGLPESERSKVLLESIEHTTGAFLSLWFVGAEMSSSRRAANRHVISEKDLPELQKACVERIRDWVATGKLIDHPKLKNILYFWKQWDKSNQPTSWLNNLISEKAGLLKFLGAYYGEFTESPELSSEALINALGMMEAACSEENILKAIELSGLKSEEPVVRIFRKAGLAKVAWEAQNKGKHPDLGTL